MHRQLEKMASQVIVPEMYCPGVLFMVIVFANEYEPLWWEKK